MERVSAALTAIVNLDNTALVDFDSRLTQSSLSSCPGHVRACELDRAALVVQARRVRLERHPSNLDRLVLESVLLDKRLGYDDGTGGSVRSWAAFSPCKVLRDLLVRKDLLPGHRVAELRVGVVDRVLVVLRGDLGDVLPCGGRVVVDVCERAKRTSAEVRPALRATHTRRHRFQRAEPLFDLSKASDNNRGLGGSSRMSG